MEITADITTLRETLAEWRHAGNTIAFVPTMGNLHQGHLSLVELAKQHADKVVVSIFVNPLQFGPNEDLASYPRTLADDCNQLKNLKVNCVFTPTHETLYPNGENTTRVTVPEVAKHYCGNSRPHFFEGVATVVTKLFNIVQPDMAIFGKKDYQQGVVIQTLVADLNLPIKIIMGETGRADNGLALSSRNGYLNDNEKAQAATLYQTLLSVKDAIQSGYQDFAAITMNAKAHLSAAGFVVDYFDIANRRTMTPANAADKSLLVLAAATLGKTRLIDNIEVDV